MPVRVGLSFRSESTYLNGIFAILGKISGVFTFFFFHSLLFSRTSEAVFPGLHQLFDALLFNLPE
jgi:succinate dehydrogenase/fumarate reductase cytochrome b subunit